MTHHAKQLFPIALDRLLAIGEKGKKQKEDRDRAKQASKASFTRACMHEDKQAKQLKLELQTRI